MVTIYQKGKPLQGGCKDGKYMEKLKQASKYTQEGQEEEPEFQLVLTERYLAGYAYI